jgi:hypothetical protein
MKVFSILILILTLTSCSNETAPPGRILVLNTSQDKSYNIVEVYAEGRSFTLKPGDKALLPKGVTTINFSRDYQDHTKRYTVKCPANPERGISMKLLDVHLNRISGGCKTISYTK